MKPKDNIITPDILKELTDIPDDYESEPIDQKILEELSHIFDNDDEPEQ